MQRLFESDDWYEKLEEETKPTQQRRLQKQITTKEAPKIPLHFLPQSLRQIQYEVKPQTQPMQQRTERPLTGKKLEGFKQMSPLEKLQAAQGLQTKVNPFQQEDQFDEILCPYCSDKVVRNFLNDHLVDCIQYIEHQFKQIEKLEECTICMEDITQNSQTLRCKHTFHQKCIAEWKLKTSECPVCRKPI